MLNNYTNFLSYHGNILPTVCHIFCHIASTIRTFCHVNTHICWQSLINDSCTVWANNILITALIHPVLQLQCNTWNIKFNLRTHTSTCVVMRVESDLPPWVNVTEILVCSLHVHVGKCRYVTVTKGKILYVHHPE